MFLHSTWKPDGESELYLFRNKDLFQRKYSNTFFPNPPHNPHNQRSISTDTQEEAVNSSKNLLP